MAESINVCLGLSNWLSVRRPGIDLPYPPDAYGVTPLEIALKSKLQTACGSRVYALRPIGTTSTFYTAAGLNRLD